MNCFAALGASKFLKLVSKSTHLSQEKFMKHLQILIAALTLLPATTFASAGYGACAAALIEKGDTAYSAVNSSCRDIKTDGAGYCAAALIKKGETAYSAVNSSCQDIKTEGHGLCAAALIKKGDTAYNAVNSSCKDI
jgi:hypothetical protein